MAVLFRLEADLGRHINAMAGDLRLLVSLRHGCGSLIEYRKGVEQARDGILGHQFNKKTQVFFLQALYSLFY
jgi:hypothetical protein